MTQYEKIKKAEALYESLERKTEELNLDCVAAEGAYSFLLQHFYKEYKFPFGLVDIARDEADALHKKHIVYIKAKSRAYCLLVNLRYPRRRQ